MTQAVAAGTSASLGVPARWYNVLADLGIRLPPEKSPPHTSGGRLQLNVPKQLVRQSMGLEPWPLIPDPVRAAYARWRPTPLRRARVLEEELGTRTRIYYKFEGENLAGTHKLLTALAQAYLYREAGVQRLVTCTAAGQWGTALALAAAELGMACRIYMVEGSYEHKPYRRTLMELLGAEVIRSPSDHTPAGRQALEEGMRGSSSLALAMTEAVQDASTDPQARWILGGSEPFAILHSTVIGLEAIRQLRSLGEWPDIVIGYLGGGKNFGGLAFPFLASNAPGPVPRLLAVESAAYPVLTRGRYAYDHTDRSGQTPLAKMYTLGRDFPTRPIHAQGMRYHAAPKIVSALYHDGRVEAVAYQEPAVFDAAIRFIRTEGLVPSPEASYAVRAAIDEATVSRKEDGPRVVLFCLSDHGLFDLAAYQSYLDGEVREAEVGQEEILASLQGLPARRSRHDR